jgi:hypothetical protein
MKNPVWETMTCWKALYNPQYTIRVWREEPQPSRGPDAEVLEVIRSMCDCDGYLAVRIPIQQLIAAIAELPRVSAIEVLDPNKNGTVFYPDWK